MPLKEPLMVKTVEGNTDLKLEAKPGQSLLIKGIKIYNPASNYATLYIEKTTVGFFRVGGTLGNQLAFTKGQVEYQNDYGSAANRYRVEKFGQEVNLLDFLIQKGFMKGYPVEEGQTFKISGVAQSGAVQQVIYQIYDAGDMKRDMPNGSAASEYLYINYIRPSSAINKTGDTLYSVSQSPAEFPAFPAGVDVPAKHEISILGICASDFAPNENDGTNYILTKYIKMVRGREVLFDEDKQGIPVIATSSTVNGSEDIVGGGISLPGQCSDVDKRLPYIFPEPLVFTSGEELNIYLTTSKTGTGQNIAVNEAEIGLIQLVKIKS